MSRWKDYFLCISLFYITAGLFLLRRLLLTIAVDLFRSDLLHAQDLSFPHRTNASDDAPISWESAVSGENSTESVNDSLSLSTENAYNHFRYREPVPPRDELNQSTSTSPVQNLTDADAAPLRRKQLVNEQPVDITNATLEQFARQLTDRRIMQSLIHLIPPNLWSQIQNNRTVFPSNQTQYNRPMLPNPVILAEAAAQAGLPGPGPYPIPEHLWPHNPLPMAPRPGLTRKCQKASRRSKSTSLTCSSTRANNLPRTDHHAPASPVHSDQSRSTCTSQ